MNRRADMRPPAARLTLGVVLACACVASASAQQSAVDATTADHEIEIATAAANANFLPERPDSRDEGAAAAPADHIPPPAPQHPMQPMSARQMTDVMEMDDTAPLAMLKLDRLELTDGDDGVATSWKLAAWAGGDFDKFLLRSEGEQAHGQSEDADAEVLWSHAAAAFWDTELGVRHDFGSGPDRNWAAFGVAGLAPYWFEIEATAYVGDSGRTALRVEVDYDLALTQRLILQPRFELNAYGKDDPAARVGSGLSDAELGLRLRFEIRREFAPYIGVERVRRFGETASFVEGEGMNPGETQWVVGVRVWY